MAPNGLKLHAASIQTTWPNGALRASVDAHSTGNGGASPGNVPQRSVRNTSDCGTTPCSSSQSKHGRKSVPLGTRSRGASPLLPKGVCAHTRCRFLLLILLTTNDRSNGRIFAACFAQDDSSTAGPHSTQSLRDLAQGRLSTARIARGRDPLRSGGQLFSFLEKIAAFRGYSRSQKCGGSMARARR